LNNMQKCSNRDAEIIALLHTHQVLCTEQIACLLFRGLRQPLLVCRRRLKSLAEHGRIARRPFAPYASNVYAVESWPKQWEHRLGINWVYCWLRATLKPGESLAHWQAPYDTGSGLKPDALWGIREQGGTMRFSFLEMERGTNPFDKPALYNAYYEQKNYQNEWWVAYAERFPGIIVVTGTEARRQRLAAAVAGGVSASRLRWEVHTLTHLQQKSICWLLPESG
jgi:hypothetical protein